MHSEYYLLKPYPVYSPVKPDTAGSRDTPVDTRLTTDPHSTTALTPTEPKQALSLPPQPHQCFPSEGFSRKTRFLHSPFFWVFILRLYTFTGHTQGDTRHTHGTQFR